MIGARTVRKGYAEGFEAGRKSLADAMIRQLDGMLEAYNENVVKWENEDESYDENAIDARAVITDLRKVVRMLI